MKAVVLGLAFALACAGLGFWWGRRARADTDRREASSHAAAPPPAAVPPPPPADLPTDARQGDSVPRGLE